MRIAWQIPSDAEPGTYRILFRGSTKEAGSATNAFLAETRPFDIVAE